MAEPMTSVASRSAYTVACLSVALVGLVCGLVIESLILLLGVLIYGGVVYATRH
jgi:hypothetical protein